MYRTENITEEQLRNVEIKDQAMIERYRGSALNPLETYRLIKESTDGFTKDDPVAKEADQLLYWLVYPEKRAEETKQSKDQVIQEPSSQTSLEELKLREKERLRALELLELELELEIDAKKKTA